MKGGQPAVRPGRTGRLASGRRLGRWVRAATGTARWIGSGLREAFALLTGLPFAAAASADPAGTSGPPCPICAAGSEPSAAITAAASGRPGAALAFFPVVGLAVGAVQAAAYGVAAPLFGPSPAALVALAAGFLVTRGLHWDGWLDCCDALLGAHTRQRRLAILRDSHVGAFAVVGGIWMALAQWLAVAHAPRPAAALMEAATAGRWAMAVSVAAFPAARPEGLGAWVRAGSARWHAAVATALALAAAMALGGLPAAGLMILAGAAGLAFAAWANRLLGGLTGDVYGAVQVVAETAALWLELAAGGGATAGGAAR